MEQIFVNSIIQYLWAITKNLFICRTFMSVIANMEFKNYFFYKMSNEISFSNSNLVALFLHI